MRVDLPLALAVQLGLQLRADRREPGERSAMGGFDVNVHVQELQPDADLLPGVDGRSHVGQPAEHAVHLGGNDDVASLQAIPQELASRPILQSDRVSRDILVNVCLIERDALALGPLHKPVQLGGLAVVLLVGGYPAVQVDHRAAHNAGPNMNSRISEPKTRKSMTGLIVAPPKE